MTDSLSLSEQCLHHARELVGHLERGDDVSASHSLEELSAIRESQIFQDLGKLTRQLHDTLSSFQLDSKLAEMTAKDIPDAKERLNYVITMTQQAADQTLNAVESALPVAEELMSRSAELHKAWDRFRGRELGADEFRKLAKDIDVFFGWLAEHAPRMHANMSDVLMAQSFQDLTGQIIKRVITLVQEVETSLVEIIRLTGGRFIDGGAEEKTVSSISPCGPVVPTVDKGDVMTGQDDVDALLSSLGF